MIAPPSPVTDGAAEILALFAEARRRRRRIRLTAAVVMLVLAMAAGRAVTFSRSTTAPAGSGHGGAGGPAAAVRSPQVVWVGWDGHVHSGNLATRTQRVVTEIDADATTPLVQVAGRVYWVDQGGAFTRGAFWPAVIKATSVATGNSADIGPGEWIFPSVGGRQVYISQTDTSLLQEPAEGSGASRQLTLPPGWFVPHGYSLAVADGILVQSNDDQAIRHPPVLAVWDPLNGQVRRIGRAVGGYWGSAISAYTPAGAGYSLLAWMPATCRFPVSCTIRITNTSTLSSRTLHSPLPYGFALGGAFSPDGRQLAVFVNRSQGTGGGTAELAIVSTATGSLHLVPGTRLAIGEDIAWARWLPGGRQLIAGSWDRDYAVTAATRAARPLSFGRDGDPVPNYSSVVVTPRR